MQYFNPYILIGSLLYGAGESLVDNFVRDNVAPVPGSLVYCDLWCFEHSGIAISDTEIVHLNGDGLVEVVSHKAFRNRLDGYNNALSIYVSAYKDHWGDVSAVGSKVVARRAERLIGQRMNYSLLDHNCHSFSHLCLTGSVDDVSFFSALKMRSARLLNANTWRVAK